MISEVLTDSDTPNNEVIIKIRRTRYNPDRHLPDGRYDSRPLDPEYRKKYYLKKLK